MTNCGPLYSKGCYYKLVGGDKVMLGGNGFVELFIDSSGGHRYFLNGVLHREDGPALITSCGSYAEWYIKGRLIHPTWLETRKVELGIRTEK